MLTDRTCAGTLLARKLSSQRGSQSIVIGLPRGGVIVAARVADLLGLPLDVLVVKKIGAPHNSELAIGAVAPDGVFFADQALAAMVGADEQYLKTQNTELNDQIKQKTAFYRKNRGTLGVKGKTVIVVDDGAATGATVFAAVGWLKKKKAGQVVVALPVAPRDFIDKAQKDIDTLIVLETPQNFSSVGQFYKNFPQVSDDEVIHLLQ